MTKKIILLILTVLVVGSAGFFWWQNQKDVRELNKNLPEGVRVVKSLIGKEYKVVNKIDGYEFKVPHKWNGLDRIEYRPEKIEQGYTASSMGLEGKEGVGRILGIDCFKIENLEGFNLEEWAKTYFVKFGLVGEFTKDKIEEFEIVKTQENVHFGGMYVYFFQKNSVIYGIISGSEEFIRYIITNGKW